MTNLDTEWAVTELRNFVWESERILRTSDFGEPYVWTRADSDELAERAYVVERILDKALPGWRSQRPSEDSEYQWLREQAARATAALGRAEELAEKLGDDAPEMDASQLHPWVWESARGLWATQHFAEAVQAAAVRVNAETQTKLGRRDVSEVSLFNVAFSPDQPKPDAPRLRLMADDGSKTYDSLIRGPRAFADGLYTAIRNPAAHDPKPERAQQLAMEQLAAFSILARWVDEATVERA